MSKYFLLSASLIALLSSQTFASKQTARELADRESSQQAIIAKLMAPNGNNDYTLALDEEKIAERITKATLTLNGNDDGEKIKPEDIKFEAKHRIRSNLDSAKTSQIRFGNGYFLTQNRAKAVSVGNRLLPLVYPVQKELRNEYNAFYPATYQNRGHGQYLCDEVKAYSRARGLTLPESDRLYKYLEPLFYLVQEELHQMVTGLGNNKWVAEKSYEELLTSLQSQTHHHFYLVRNIPVKGLDQEQVRTALLTALLGKGLALLPNPRHHIHINTEGVKYYLGKNKHGHVSLIYPSADNLPYPILKNYRSLERANLPYETQITPALQKQWRRIGEFVQVHPRFNDRNRALMKNVLDGVGTIFDRHLSRFHVQQAGFPVGNIYQLLTEDMADEFAGNRSIPEPWLAAFYGGGSMLPDFPVVINQVYRKANAHFYLTGDLWPSYITEDHKRDILFNSVRYLFFKDILDRAAEFEALHPVDVRALALGR